MSITSGPSEWAPEHIDPSALHLALDFRFAFPDQTDANP